CAWQTGQIVAWDAELGMRHAELTDPIPQSGVPSGDPLGASNPHSSWRNMARREDLAAGWAFPLLAGPEGAVIGVLEIYFGPTSDHNLELLRIAAGQLAAILLQATVQEKMGRRLAEALLLREVSQMI